MRSPRRTEAIGGLFLSSTTQTRFDSSRKGRARAVSPSRATRRKAANDLDLTRSEIDKAVEALSGSGHDKPPHTEHWDVKLRPKPVDGDASCRSWCNASNVTW
jgi:hypothetical protein